MKRVVSAEEMRSFEQELFALGESKSLVWMERAAEGIDSVLAERYAGLPVLAVCGGGNNGGDGFALLRLLKRRGVACKGVLLADPERLKGDAKTNYLRALDCGVVFESALTEDALKVAGVIVDAMFGTGLKYPLTGVYRDAAEQINNSGKPVVAVDIPSGVYATTGKVSQSRIIAGFAVQADVTVTFQFYKRGNLLFPGRALCGDVIVHPLETDPNILYSAKKFELLFPSRGYDEMRRELDAFFANPEADCSVTLFEQSDAARLLPKRPLDSHKGKNGRALLCVGSGQYTGAALLASSAALRAGAGLLTAAVPGAVKPAFAQLPEAMAVSVCEGNDWDEEACKRASELLDGKNAVGIGCGVGEGNVLPLVRSALECGVPLLLDADALNQISNEKEILSLLHPNVVLTPHPAEMARLAGEAVEDILWDPVEIARKYAKLWNCVVLLKGATTCISDGTQVRLNVSGNPGLAKGGSGDVLSGIITALLAQGLKAFDAASVGAYLLGASADVALDLLRERALLARDVIEVVERTANSFFS
ncbi:MAG: NAD(P)H-hydrate dehydratase [Clostridiaceae bacterium]